MSEAITKAAQDALAALEEIHAGKRHPQLALAVAQQLRAALKDKAGDVRGYEPAGFLLHWPAPGGGRDTLWSKDGAAGHAIGCPVTEVFKATDLASHPAPVVPDDVARYRAIRDGLVYIEPHESGEIYVAGETGVYTKSGDEFDAAIDAIATSQQKEWSAG